MNPTHQVVDEFGAVHALVKRLGVGGQGEVWLAAGGRRVVKLLNNGGNPESLRRQFAFVRRLDLHGIHVAKPIAVLKPPHVGYVADFLGEMVAIKSIMQAPSANLASWHIASGGLRRRLRLLAHAGEALVALHGRGVIYTDVSHNNVFISEPVGAAEAWLIDLDNLRYQSDPALNLYTPGYGAPEIVAGRAGCTSLSDAWAFAVLVWQALTLTHPFVGDLVTEGDPEVEELAFAGGLPWVRHQADTRNACTSGLPPELVLAPRLVELARRTFEDGLSDRAKRPGIAEWVERLHAAADQAILCPDCAATYFVTETACSWCDAARPELATLRITRWQPSHGRVEGSTRLGQFPVTRTPLKLPRRVTQGVPGVPGRELHVEFELVAKGVRVRTAPGCGAWAASVSRDSERYPIDERGRVVPKDGWMVFFDNPDLPQRIAVIGRTQ
ncbi:MAG: hypothetical protein EXR77_17840 [Myxococcales bacterium]|nr:hypothetical protein [Myxococcales bacterium]